MTDLPRALIEDVRKRVVSGYPAQVRAALDSLTDEPALSSYHLLPSVRGDLLSKLGRVDEARAEFERAAALTRNVRERALLRRRAGACGRAGGAPMR